MFLDRGCLLHTRLRQLLALFQHLHCCIESFNGAVFRLEEAGLDLGGRLMLVEVEADCLLEFKIFLLHELVDLEALIAGILLDMLF